MFIVFFVNDEFMPTTHPKKKNILEVKRLYKAFSGLNKSRGFAFLGSGFRTDSDILAVPDPVLMDFFTRVQLSGSWTDPGKTLQQIYTRQKY